MYQYLFYLSIAALVTFFILYRKKIGERPEIGFLAVALICGSLLSFSELKTYVSWDEQIHYKRAEKLAASVVPNMFFRPNSVDSSYSIEEQKKFDVQTDNQYKKPMTKSSTSGLSYSKIVYMPSAIMIALGNLLRLPFHIIFMLARWVNLLVYSAIVFAAIRKLKSGKMIMAVVALFPTSLFLASNYGYDWWVTAFTMLGLACVFSELQQPDKKITVQEMVIMVGAFVIGLGPKPIYFLLMAPLFLLKRSKFESPKQYKAFMWASALAVICVVSSFLLPFLISGSGGSDSRGGYDVNSTRQVHFMLSQPVTYTKILLNFIKDYSNPLNAEGFTNFFAYLGMTGGFWFILSTLTVVTVTDKNEYDKTISGWKMKLIMLAVYFATVALIASALYISFTPVASATIGGVQPRYLIPLVFPLLFVIGSNRVKNPFNKNIYNTVIFAIMAFVMLQGTWELIIRNYH